MKVYGYIRISSANQRIDRQIIDLQTYNVPKESIFIDKKSGKNFDRPNYRALVKKLQRGDLLYIKSIDRLGRNADEVQKQWKVLTRKKNVDIFVIDTPYLDTRVKADFLHEFINNLFLYVLSFVAENERMLTRKRQAEGIRAAKQRGVHFGRTRKPLPKNFTECCELYLTHQLTVRDAAQKCGMAKSTFADAVKRAIAEEQVKNTENPSESKENTAPAEKPVTPEEATETPEAFPQQTARNSSKRDNNRTEIFTFSRNIMK